MEATQTHLIDEHYEAIGRIVMNLPDKQDEVRCLLAKELFADENIFDNVNGEWNFSARDFLEKHPTIEDANYYAEMLIKINLCTGYMNGCGCMDCTAQDIADDTTYWERNKKQ